MPEKEIDRQQGSSISPPPRGGAKQKTVEERLRDAEERFRLFMENVKEYAVFMLDTQGRVVDWNLGAEHVLGYGEEILGQPFAVFFPPDDRSAGIPEKELNTATETGQSSDDRWHVRKDGTFFWALGITTAMFDEQHALKGFTKVLRDSTERKHFEDELNNRNKALADADRRKDEFLAMLGHELRNPLAPIFNALSLLAHEDVSAETQREMRLLIDRQSRTLARLVDDLLDVSRISMGKLQLRKSEIELRIIIDNAVQQCRPVIEAHRHKLTVTSPRHPIWLDVDQIRLEQVIANLLNNAAKYSENGSDIHITAAQEHEQAVVRVRDGGIGIAPDRLLVIFDLYAQVDSSLSLSEGGLGIGLTLAKKLVEMHGGTLEAHSEGIGKGSEFIVKLPILSEIPPTRSRDQSIEAPTKAETQLLVFIVDDNVDAAETLRMILDICGHNVQTAYNGQNAVDLAPKIKPDVMIVDLGLPGLDGYQVAKRVREMSEVKDIVLIAMTGYDQEEHRRRSEAAGFDYHLVKPVRLQKIEELLRLIGKKKEK